MIQHPLDYQRVIHINPETELLLNLCPAVCIHKSQFHNKRVQYLGIIIERGIINAPVLHVFLKDPIPKQEIHVSCA